VHLSTGDQGKNEVFVSQTDKLNNIAFTGIDRG